MAARAAAERAAVARAQLIAQIDARRDLTAELASELQTAQQQLQQTLGAINCRRAARRSPTGSALPIRPFRGDLDWPVAGRIMTRFSGQATAGAGRDAAERHPDLRSQEGTPVRAVHDGTVAFAGPFTGYGNLVIVDHGAADLFALRAARRDVRWSAAPESIAARPSAPRAACCRDSRGSISRCASTASRSIR